MPMKHCQRQDMIAEYKLEGNQTLAMTRLDFYPDLNSWVKMGEDTYPNVVDTLGDISRAARWLTAQKMTSSKSSPREAI